MFLLFCHPQVVENIQAPPTLLNLEHPVAHEMQSNLFAEFQERNNNNLTLPLMRPIQEQQNDLLYIKLAAQVSHMETLYNAWSILYYLMFIPITVIDGGTSFCATYPSIQAFNKINALQNNKKFTFTMSCSHCLLQGVKEIRSWFSPESSKCHTQIMALRPVPKQNRHNAAVQLIIETNNNVLAILKWVQRLNNFGLSLKFIHGFFEDHADEAVKHPDWLITVSWVVFICNALLITAAWLEKTFAEMNQSKTRQLHS